MKIPDPVVYPENEEKAVLEVRLFRRAFEVIAVLTIAVGCLIWL